MSIRYHPLGSVLAVSGAALQIGSVISLWRIISDLRGAFSTLGASGIGDPSHLIGAAGEVLGGSAVGLGLGLFGLVLLCAALVGARYRAIWFQWFVSIYSIFLLVVFPIGTAIGIFFLIYIHAHHPEFGRAS